jgi:HAD superfamily hydrolase (TIGR01549 family)
VSPTRDWRAVLFDWVGTLVDTAEASFRCYVKLFSEFGLEFDRARYAETYSPNWHYTYRCMGLGEERWSEADAAWLRHFAEERPELIDGALDVLESIAARGLLRGIVTSASRGRIHRELINLQLEHHFAHIVCGDDGPRRKPDPEALQVCLSRLEVAPEQAVYIGDSPEDMEMARAAGVFAVAVPGAYPNTAALKAASADMIASSLDDALSRLFR